MLGGIIIAIIVLSMIGNVMNDVQGSWNQATQHKRDKAILDELRKMNKE